ncbi:MAG TPA: hypothetical protein VFQ61_14975 [Polyangiaceae bacterium]|nr:hypothetical protein [Polyangiaceae bacterium]
MASAPSAGFRVVRKHGRIELGKLAVVGALACALLAVSSAYGAGPAKNGAEPRAEVTFSGFRDLGAGRAIVFVELTDRVEVSVSQKGTEVVYELKGAVVRLKNNQNPLVTSAFSSNLLSARLTPIGKMQKAPKAKAAKPRDKSTAQGVQLILKLRQPVVPAYKFIERSTGVVFEITIPAG